MADNLQFREIVDSYIAEKKAVGYNFEKGSQQLKKLVSLYEQMGYTQTVLPKDVVLAYTEKKPYETETNRSHRISAVRGLAAYMQRIDLEAYSFPYKSTPYVESAYQPHIFSNNELAALFSVIDNSISSTSSPFRQIQFSLLFRMLYGTGMRINEALGLLKNDVDLSAGTVFVKHAKLDKERILPLAESLTERARDYENYMQLQTVWKSSMYFFPNSAGNKYDSNSFYHYFRTYLWKAGISHGGRGKGPRVHDLRHTYSVHCLRNWVREGKELSTALPYLSAYLGHVGMRSTQHYLRLTTELYPEITAGLDSAYGWVIPEVADAK